MLVTLFEIVMLVKLLQFSKAQDGMVVTLSPMLIVVSFEQFLNIKWSDEPALVHAVAFQLTVVKPLQFSKALQPMLVTPLPIVTLVRPLQFSKA